MSRYLANRGEIVASLKAFADRYRLLLFLAAFSLFLTGLIWSIRQLDIGIGNLEIAPLLLNLLVLSPLALLLTSWGLQISARVLSRRISQKTALTTTAVGTVAELLPIPAGIVARTAALVRIGAGPREIASVLSMGGMLWFGLSAIAGSFALSQTSQTLNMFLLGAGLAAAIASLRWFALQTEPRWVLAVLLHRCVSLVVGVLRICVAFSVLGKDISVVDAALLASANIVGSYSSIVPAGLGLGEALAALAAQAIVLSASVAFTAIAMNRVIGLVVAATAAVLLGKQSLSTASDRRA